MRKRKVFIIAEAGVNHNGSVEAAKRMIDVAREAGADAVKFQTFKTENLVIPGLEKTRYQAENTGTDESQFEMLRKLELSFAEFKKLFAYCKEKNILFMSSPFDLEGVDFLDKLGLKIFKIPSGEMISLPYLKRIGNLRKKVIISTGMADLEEIEKALGILTKAGTAKKDITILHCNTDYPTPYGDVNLHAMLTIKDAFKVNVGYSDHTLGIEIPIAAVALGASVIEKHFTLDRGMEGPDHRASLEPDDLKGMVSAIRNIEKSLGDGVKRPSPSELKNRPIARKSIVAAKDIKKGEIFTKENITLKRPGTGMSPIEWPKILGRIARKDFKENEAIKL